MTEAGIRACPPTELSDARAIAHKAVQLVTAAARANLEPAADDSHSNLGWDAAGDRFLSQPLAGQDGDLFVGLALSPLRLDLISNGQSHSMYEMHGQAMSDAYKWLDSQLSDRGLKPASGAHIPYALPPEAAAVSAVATDQVADQMACLAAWFDLAATHLEQFAADNSDLSPGPVRCWPHHFDIASYVQLETGDFESARGIGVGLSPGDESYDQPYFYINPWPHLDPSGLPDLPAPGHWHTEGFVGAIATGEEVLMLDDIAQGLPHFISRAFEIGRNQLGV